MNEPSRPSDREITDLLRRRSARAAPDALAFAVLESLASERARHPVRTTGRSAKRPLVLLAAAALLLVGGALAAGSGVLRQTAIVPPVTAPTSGQVAIASPDAAPPSSSDFARPSASPIRAAGPGSWIATGSMITPRYSNIAVRLADGRVLVAGGNANPRESLTSVELYDPSTGTWSATGSMVQPLDRALSTLLPDGRVLVVGATGDNSRGAELYEPTSGTWTAAEKPSSGILSTATLLPDGKVLIVGSNGAQLYDPGSETWTATGRMVIPRYNHTATLLPDGRVLVAGGDVFDRWMKSAELYDPQTNSWIATADMPEPSDVMQATLLQDGTVLVVGSSRGAVLYDPSTGTWTTAGKPPAATSYTFATRLLDGTVLLAGGHNGAPGDGAPGASELYDPATRSWTGAASMLPSSDGVYPSNQATLLLDGTVLVTGGWTCTPNLGCPTGATGFAELYVPAGVTPPDLGPLPSPTPTPVPTPVPTPYPPTAGPVPHGARPWEVTVVNRSSKDAPLFLVRQDSNGVGQLCGSVTPDVVPAQSTEKVTFQLPPKSDRDCQLGVRPLGGLAGSNWYTADVPQPGHLLIQDGGDNANGDDLSTVWVGP